MLAAFDGTLSSLFTCHPPVSAQSGSGAYSKPNQEECTALRGPILISLTWLLNGLHKYEGAIVAIFTIILAVFTGRLWYSTDKLWGATKNLVEGSERTAERQLRAYVQIKDVLMSLMNTEYDPNIDIVIKNFGQTPARQIVNTFNVKFAFQPRDEDFTLDSATKGEVSDLAPGQRVNSQTTIRVKKWNEMKPALTVRKMAFYVFGRIDYIDAFNEPRWTEYRFRLLIDADGISDKKMSLIMEGHAGNRAN
jgi:hypothetical protein